MVARPVGEDCFEVSISGANFGKGSYRATDYLTRDRLDPPEYPAEAQRMGGKGTVYLVLRIGRDGRVADLLVEQVNLTAIGTESQMAKMREYLGTAAARSEEHTSELQSLMRISYAVFCLKKKT